MIDLGNYNGGKGNVFRHIINEIPPHSTFVEAFVGGGSVALNKRPAQRNILIDKDPEVIESWLSHIATNDDGRPGYLVTFDDGTRYELYCGDALQLLPLLNLGPQTLVYADPPYLFDVRTEKRPLYRHEMGTAAEHTNLIQLLRGLGCKVMLSGYWSELYADLLHDWRHFTFTAYDQQNRPRQEYVWCNFPEPARLHDYSYLGDNFRERERIKRKAARWVGRFQKLPALERRAILSQLDAAGVLD